MNEIINNLLSIKQKLDEFESERRKTELYNSNRFNLFRFMHTGEIGLSNILAFLLDPNETHGQGELFLNSFLKIIGKHNFLAFDSVNVITEKTTFNNRRHDIFIEGWLDNKRDWAISIENKLRGAVDQPNQMNDYTEDLKHYTLESYFLIYLTKDGDNPSDYSISEERWENLVTSKKAIVLSANMLIKWLDSTEIMSSKIKEFCDDFKKFLSEDIMKKSQSNNELVAFLIKNDALLSSALAIFDTREMLYRKLIEDLIDKLNDNFKNRYPQLISNGFKINETENFYKKNYWIYIGNDNIGVGIRFYEPELGGAFYGVYANDDDSFKVISNIFSGDGFTPHHNFLWKKLDEEDHYKKWDAKVMEEIRNGDLVNYIFKLWGPLLDVITENLDKIKELEIKKL